MPQLSENLRLFQRILVNEFLREFQFLVDVDAGRAVARADFTDKILSVVKNLISAGISNIPVPTLSLANTLIQEALTALIPKLIDWIDQGIQTSIDKANDSRKENGKDNLFKEGFKIDELIFRSLLETVALEACARYQYFLLKELSDDPLEGIVPFAKAGVERMLEYVLRTRSPLTVENLVTGLVAGHSGAYVSGYTNTQLSAREQTHQTLAKRIKKKVGFTSYTAEGAYGRSGFMTPEGQLYALPDKKQARHRVIQTETLPESTLEKLKLSRNKYFAYGYTKFKKDSHDPKYGYIYAPIAVVDQWYGHLNIRATQSFDQLTLNFQAKIKSFKPEIIRINRIELESYLKVQENNPTLSFLDFIRSKPQQDLDISNAKLLLFYGNDEECDLRKLNLAGCDLSDIVFLGCRFAGSLDKTQFQRSNCSYSDFSEVISAKEANFTEANLSYTKFNHANLEKSIIVQADFTYADLTNTRLSGAITLGAIWQKAKLDALHSSPIQHIVDDQHFQEQMLLQQKKDIDVLNIKLQKQQEELSQLQANLKIQLRAHPELNESISMQQALYQEKQARLILERCVQAELIRLKTLQEVNEKRLNEHGKQFKAQLQKLDEQRRELDTLSKKLLSITESVACNENKLEEVQTDVIILKKQVKTLIEEDKTKQLATNVCDCLKRAYRQHTEIKSIFGKTFQLEDQYINLQMLYHVELNKDDRKRIETEKNKHDKYQYASRIRPEELFKPNKDLFSGSFSNEKQKNVVSSTYLIQGQAGVGKTTLIQFMAKEWANDKLFQTYQWAFVLHLRDLRSPKFQRWEEQKKQLNLCEWVFESLIKPNTNIDEDDFYSVWQQAIEPGLKSDKVLIILDGYDELPVNHPCQDILKSLKQGAYANVPKIITSRPYGTADLPENRRDLEINGFTDENIEQYVKTYFVEHLGLEKTKKIIKTIKASPSLWGVAHIPVALSLICGIVDQASERFTEAIEEEITDLKTVTGTYETIEEKLLERCYLGRETQKYTTFPESKKRRCEFLKNHYQLHRRFLAELAFNGLSNQQIILSRDTIDELLNQYQIQDDATFMQGIRELGLIRPIIEKNLVLENEQNYEFIHLTFQEYYTAIHIAEMLQSENPMIRENMERLVLIQKHNPQWQLVWWFVVSLNRDKANGMQVFNLLRGLAIEFDQQKAELNRFPITFHHIKITKTTLATDTIQKREEDQNNYLNHDMIGHYELGLLVRCLEESSNLDKALQTKITQRLQQKILYLYQLFQKGLLSRAFSSSLLESLRISPKMLKQTGASDLFAKIKVPMEKIASNEEKINFLEFIISLGFATSLAYNILIKLLTEEDIFVIDKALDAISRVRATVSPEFLDQLGQLISNNKDTKICDNAVKAAGHLFAAATTPEILGGLVQLLLKKPYNSHDSSSPIHSIKRIGAAAATPEFLEHLAKLLTNKESYVLYNALQVLDALGPVAATPEILMQLAKLLKNNKVGKGALETLGKLGPTAATPEILKLLVKLLAKNKFGKETLEAIGKLGPIAATPKILEKLNDLLIDNDFRDYRFLVSTLSYLKKMVVTPKTLDRLIMLLIDQDYFIRESVVKLIHVLEPEVVSELLLQLVQLLNDDEQAIRLRAVESVSQFSMAATIPEILRQLIKLLADKNCDIRRKTVHVITELGREAMTAEIIEQLDKLRTDEDSKIREAVVYARGKLGIVTTSEFLKELTLFPTGGYIPDWVADAIGQLGDPTAAPEIMEELANALTDDSQRWMRWRPLKLISRLGSAVTPKILNLLIILLGAKARYDADDDIRYVVVETIRQLDSAAATPQFLVQLIMLVTTEDYQYNRYIRMATLDAIGYLGRAAAIPEVLELLSKLLEEGCIQAASVISRLGEVAATPKILEHLTKLLTDENKSYYGTAAETLSKLGIAAVTPEILVKLANLCVNEKEAVRKRAASALSSLVKRYFDYCIETWLQQSPTISSVQSLQFLSTIFCGAYLAGNIHCQIFWDSKNRTYSLEIYMAKEKSIFAISLLQAQYLRHLVPIIIYHLENELNPNIRTDILQKLIKKFPKVHSDSLLFDMPRGLEKKSVWQKASSASAAPLNTMFWSSKMSDQSGTDVENDNQQSVSNIDENEDDQKEKQCYIM